VAKEELVVVGIKLLRHFWCVEPRRVSLALCRLGECVDVESRGDLFCFFGAGLGGRSALAFATRSTGGRGPVPKLSMEIGIQHIQTYMINHQEASDDGLAAQGPPMARPGCSTWSGWDNRIHHVGLPANYNIRANEIE
jgi:hypothetical protein